MSENDPPQIAPTVTATSTELTAAEESYINKCVTEFGKGELKDCEDGCTLLMYLSRKLKCETKKITDYFDRKKARHSSHHSSSRSKTSPPLENRKRKHSSDLDSTASLTAEHQKVSSSSSRSSSRHGSHHVSTTLPATTDPLIATAVQPQEGHTSTQSNVPASGATVASSSSTSTKKSTKEAHGLSANDATALSNSALYSSSTDIISNGSLPPNSSSSSTYPLYPVNYSLAPPVSVSPSGSSSAAPMMSAPYQPYGMPPPDMYQYSPHQAGVPPPYTSSLSGGYGSGYAMGNGMGYAQPNGYPLMPQPMYSSTSGGLDTSQTASYMNGNTTSTSNSTSNNISSGSGGSGSMSISNFSAILAQFATSTGPDSTNLCLSILQTHSGTFNAHGIDALCLQKLLEARQCVERSIAVCLLPVIPGGLR